MDRGWVPVWVPVIGTIFFSRISQSRLLIINFIHIYFSNLLHWCGYVTHKTNSRIQKELKWPAHKPKKHYKDGLKESLNLHRAGKVYANNCIKVHDVKVAFQSSEKKQKADKFFMWNFQTLQVIRLDITCEVCSRLCSSTAGKLSHMQNHTPYNQLQNGIKDKQFM